MRKAVIILAMLAGLGGLVRLTAPAISQTGTPAATTLTTPAAVTGTGTAGQVFSLTATVSSTTVPSEGTVTFTVTNGTVTIGAPVTGNVRTGVATVSYSIPYTTPAGSYTVTANYNGTANYAASTASNTLTIKDYSNLLPQPLPAPLTYDIVYLRAPRDPAGLKEIRWPEVVSSSSDLQPGTDLILLHPDGSEEVLVSSSSAPVTGGTLYTTYMDTAISFDAKTAYVTRYQLLQNTGATFYNVVSGDIIAVSLAPVVVNGVNTYPVTQLTNGGYAPNKAAYDANTDKYPTINSCPCVCSNGTIVFTSNRSRFQPNKGFAKYTLQLYRMNMDGTNVERIGPLDLGCALHPIQLTNGQIIYSTYQAQGRRDSRMWSFWYINPDGTSWGPAFMQGSDALAFHEAAQLTNTNLVGNLYYNENAKGFGSFYQWPLPSSAPSFSSAVGTYLGSAFGNKNFGRNAFRFAPLGLSWLTPFAIGTDVPSVPALPSDPASPAVGKLCHPAGVPGGNLLACYSAGPVNRTFLPTNDSGIVLINPSNAPITAPNQMQVVKNDPAYNEMWPRAVVTYQQTYGITAPAVLPDLANNGSVNPRLPEGTPYGLVGTASLYKREDFPAGPVVGVTASNPNPADPFIGLDALYAAQGNGYGNWKEQGSVTGKYSNDDIVGIRLVQLVPLTQQASGEKRQWGNFGNERLRILGEFPARIFNNQVQITDPDGNPNTSWLAKIPADLPFTFQLLVRGGLAGDMAQTWHQVRPGEVRVNCGGCHAHSQVGTDFSLCAASQPGYNAWDLTGRTPRPMLTSKANDQPGTVWSGKQWTVADDLGIEYLPGGAQSFEYNKDIKPLLQRSCIPCHQGTNPPGNLRLDLTTTQSISQDGGAGFPTITVPDTYCILAAQKQANTSIATASYQLFPGSGAVATSRFAWPFRAMNSLLFWKVRGARTDGWQNSDFPTESRPGDLTSVPATWTLWNGKNIANTNPPPTGYVAVNMSQYCDIDFNGLQCPPPNAVDPNGNPVPPLSEREIRTIARWIDTGCTVDTDGSGSEDNQPPTLALPYPVRGGNSTALTKLIVGMCDSESGLDPTKFSVTADFAVDGKAAGTELASLFTTNGDGRWMYTLQTPITTLALGNLTVKTADLAGNRSQVVRTFAVNAAPPPPAATTTATTSVTVTSSKADQNVTLSASITSSGVVVNEGTVTFTVLSGTTTIGVPVTSGVVTSGQTSVSYVLPGGTTAGSYTIQATYNGTTNFATSQGTATLTVNVAPPAATTTATTAVTVTASKVDQNVALSATVTSNNVGVNEGTVTFTVFNGSTVMGSPVTSGVVSNGQASVTYILPAGTPAGSYTIQANYNGTANFAVSLGTAALTVNPPPNPNQAVIDDLQAQITALQAVIARLQADIAALQNPPMAPQIKIASPALTHKAVKQGAKPAVSSPWWLTPKGKGNVLQPIKKAGPSTPKK